MRPAPLAWRYGNAARIEPRVGVEVDRERVTPSVLELRLVCGRASKHAHAGVVHQDVDAAEAGDDVVDQAVELRRIAHIGDEPGRLPAGRRDLVDHGLHTVRAEIDDRDPRPLVGEQVRRRAAHAARGARHDCGLAGDRPGQLRQSGLGHLCS